MGKHERQEIEDAEKIVVKLLNNENLTEKEFKNKWYNHSVRLAEYIRKNYNDIEKVNHIGNTYSGHEIGDIKLKIEGDSNIHYIELKMSETKTGIGTLANISQDALTTSNLFSNGKIKSWSEFRKEKNFRSQILKELNRFNGYPEELESGTIRQKVIKKASYLKREFYKLTGLNTRQNSIASTACKHRESPRVGKIASILCDIVNFAREDKISYLSYLKNLNQNEENIKKFVIAMLMGYHTRDQLQHILKIPFSEVFEILNYYSVCYSNERGGVIIVSRDNLGQEIRNLIDSDVKIVFPENQTNCLIKVKSKSIIRIVFHWKNKFQGIKTPCLNIFRE